MSLFFATILTGHKGVGLSIVRTDPIGATRGANPVPRPATKADIQQTIDFLKGKATSVWDWLTTPQPKPKKQYCPLVA